MADQNTVTITIQAVDASGPAIKQAEANLAGLGTAGTSAAGAVKPLEQGLKDAGRAATGAATGHGALRYQIGMLDNTLRGAHSMAMADIVRLYAKTGLVMKALPIAATAAAFVVMGEVLVAVAEKVEAWREKQQRMNRELRDAGTAQQQVFNSLDERLLEAGMRTDQLTGNHLGALQKQLRLIDMQSMGDLIDEFGKLEKTADTVFKDLESHWYTFGFGSAGATHALVEFQGQYSSLLAQAAHKEAAGDVPGAAVLRNQASAKLAGTLAQAQRDLAAMERIYAGPRPNESLEQGAAGIAQARQTLANDKAMGLSANISQDTITAQKELLAVLNGQVVAEQKIGELGTNNSHNAWLHADKAKEGDSWAKKQAEQQKEYDRRQDENAAKLQQMQYQANGTGLTGIARIQAQGQERMGALPKEFGGDLGYVWRAGKIVQQQTNQEMVAAQQQFSDKIAGITQHSADFMLSGYIKIDAEQKASLKSLGAAYEQFYGSDQSKWEGYQQAKLQLGREADRERQTYTQQVDLRIAAQEAEAARVGMAPWMDAQQRISDSYNLRLQKIKGDVALQVVTEEQGARQVRAAWDLANSQMYSESLRTRDRIAGSLQSLSENPVRYMQSHFQRLGFEMAANSLTSLTGSGSRNGNMMQWLLGVGAPTPLGSPGNVFSGLFGAGGAAAGGNQLTVAGSTLTSAGINLQGAASGLFAASQAMMGHGVASAAGGASLPGSASFPGPTSLPGLPGFGSSTPGLFSSGMSGMSGMSGETLGIPSGLSGAGFGGGAISAGETGLGMAGMLGAGGGGISSVVQQGLQLSSFLRGAGAGGGGGLLNPGGVAGVPGGFQPSDIPPTNDAGVAGTVPGGGTTAGGMTVAGGGLAAATSGLALYGSLSSAWNAPTFASGMIGVGETTMMGAEIGGMFGPLGAAIGAAAGFAAGLVADAFGDHGATKMRLYNQNTIVPALQRDMDSFSFNGGSYDSAAIAINNLQLQADQASRQWGSGARSVYWQTVVPEVQKAEAQVAREGAAGRANISFGVSQFHGGGIIKDFGDLWTSHSTGFIHAQLGEGVFSRDDMGRSLRDLSSSLHAPSQGAVRGGGGESHTHIHIHALDVQDFNRFLARGGDRVIQMRLNQLTGRYAGRALNSQ